MNKPRIGVSRCLLGDAVRYDGQSKPCSIIIDQLAGQFELVPICPEVEADLTTPRPPVQLSGNIKQPRLIGRDDPGIDITELMLDYCQNKIPELEDLDGFIFKSRSPSCGLSSTPVFINGWRITNTSSGIFARAMQAAYPDLPMIEEAQLESSDTITTFIKSVSTHKT